MAFSVWVYPLQLENCFGIPQTILAEEMIENILKYKFSTMVIS